jgi:hypothetical protein
LADVTADGAAKTSSASADATDARANSAISATVDDSDDSTSDDSTSPQTDDAAAAPQAAAANSASAVAATAVAMAQGAAAPAAPANPTAIGHPAASAADASARAERAAADAASAADSRLISTNHDRIITGMRGTLLPHGGSMQIRLDPPSLGSLQVSVNMRNGVVSATFQTSNDDATRMLSHSLGQLKAVLEAHGVSVDKLQVQQSTRNGKSQNEQSDAGQQPPDQEAQREQQRREVMQRLWKRLSLGSDPVDMVA